MKKALISLCILVAAVLLLFGLLQLRRQPPAEQSRPEFAGTEYNSVEALEICIGNHLREISHEEIAEHLSEMENLYVPPVCVEHPERITSILVTPIWVQVTFEEGGKEYLFEHHYPDHSEYAFFQYLYDLQKDGTALLEDGGKTIYAASHTGEECDYCWLQDGECFELRALHIVPDNRDDKMLEKHLQLCDARKLVLNVNPE